MRHRVIDFPELRTIDLFFRSFNGNCLKSASNTILPVVDLDENAKPKQNPSKNKAIKDSMRSYKKIEKIESVLKKWTIPSLMKCRP